MTKPSTLFRLTSSRIPLSSLIQRVSQWVDCVWNVMAHAQKRDFVFCRNGRVHLNRRGRQFSRLLAAVVCASPLVMLDTPRSEVVLKYWLPTPFSSFPLTSPPVRQRVSSGFKRTQRPMGVTVWNSNPWIDCCPQPISLLAWHTNCWIQWVVPPDDQQ
jgi:hypothetical protein